jgi:hypothetical protein
MSSSLELTFDHDFRREAGAVLDSGQSRSIVLSGNVHDLFYLEPEYAGGDAPHGAYVSITDYLKARWGNVKNTILIVMEHNGPIRFAHSRDREAAKRAWPQQVEIDHEDPEEGFQAMFRQLQERAAGARRKSTIHPFDDRMQRATGRPAVALQILRNLCELSRDAEPGTPLFGKNLVIVVEWAEMVIPEGDIARMPMVDRDRVSICQDWFSEPAFMQGGDSVVLLTESRSLVNHAVVQLPQVLGVEIPAPDILLRDHYIHWFEATQIRFGGLRPQVDGELATWGSKQDLAAFSAGLSLLALRQMLLGARHRGAPISQEQVIARVERYIQSQLPEGMVEFKKPHHTLDDVLGYRDFKKWMRDEVMPRFVSTGKDALTGAAVSGPIGAGKTFIFEGVAAELGIPVLVLKNLRSKWFGETDSMLEKLYRVLLSLNKVMIFVDEADTMFGGVGADTHETERRLTGKIQTWMSDPRLRGKVTWLLMTARIHLLSPDIRRPGRVGSLIIPILDPEGEDRDDFIRWVLEPVLKNVPDANSEAHKKIQAATAGYSAASFAELRSELTAVGTDLTMDRILERIEDQLQPDIGMTRRYQILQALKNCTRRSLLPDPNVTEDDRAAWDLEIRELETFGIR